MGHDPVSDEVREFFDHQQADHQYASLKSMTQELDHEAARLLNAKVTGDTLSVGGIWDFFEWGSHLGSLTVLDLSPEMLKSTAPSAPSVSWATCTSMSSPPNLSIPSSSP